MQTSLASIIKPHVQFSETKPIFWLLKRHRKRSGPQWDMHYGLELGLICSGMERRLFYDKSSLNVGPGDVWFCGMWEPHGREVVKAPCSVIILWIWPPFLAQTYFPEAPDFNPLAPFNAPPRQRPRTTPQLKQTMLLFVRQLSHILSAPAPFQQIKLRFILLEMLIKIHEAWPQASRWRRRAPSAEFTLVNRAVQMVFESHSFISTAQAARECGLNRNAFGALFQSWMNISFADFLAKHRLQQAAFQLRNTLEPIKNIAQYWGFADESHFYRSFRKHFRQSPHEYRNSLFASRR